MIVKILAKSAQFNAVSYNTNKIEEDKGELMEAANFDALKGLDHVGPQDYKNYLMAQSARSSRTKLPQFHVAISAKGRAHDKHELTEIAKQWLKGMGYEGNPYLLIFHSDTKNNHIHIVSTRIDRNGRKIDDSFEKLRAYQVLDNILGIDRINRCSHNIATALSYRFATRAQFMMLLEARGYSLKLSDIEYVVSKFGKRQSSVSVASIDARIGEYQKDIDRLAQLRAIVSKYRSSHSAAVTTVGNPLPGNRTGITIGYTSKLAELLSEKLGVKLIFHGKDGKPPYGYTLIDHAQKTVYKGAELMPLAELIGTEQTNSKELVPPQYPPKEEIPLKLEIPAEFDHNLPETDAMPMMDGSGPWFGDIQIDISNDIDDEAILGRNRHRKRKARTNTR